MTNLTPWDADRLGFARIGQSFTHLVQSITDSQVITIEAGFGHGKTFFRRAWAQELRAAGEVVIEIDAQQSDHSGEPVVTFLGALLAALPIEEKGALEKAATKGASLLKRLGRVAVSIGARQATEEVFALAAEFMGQQMKADEIIEKGLKETVVELGDRMGKFGEQLVCTQLVAEHVRQTELPAQIRAIRDALTEGKPSKRIVVLIDELDRCRPDYAIALLEAMKLVFNEDGFVFVLLVNADYLNDIADHRYGTGKTCKKETEKASEKYMEKFVDFRLKLRAPPEALAEATRELVAKIELAIPFGDDPAFSVTAAAELAAKIAPESGLSFRQIKRVVERVDLVARCYRKRPIDLPLLVHLAFEQVARIAKMLERARFTPDLAEKHNAQLADDASGVRIRTLVEGYNRQYPELVLLNGNTQEMLEQSHQWHILLGRMHLQLAPHYIPDHQAMLDAVHQLMAD